MNITPTDLELLLVPIPGPDPAGQLEPGEELQELGRLRRRQPPDWAGIIERASAWLRRHGKSMHVAAQLTEALAHQQGLPGLRVGLRLLRLLIERFPHLPRVRQAVAWLTHARGSSLPRDLPRSVPLVRVEGKDFCLQDAYLGGGVGKALNQVALARAAEAISCQVWEELQDLLEDCSHDHRAIQSAAGQGESRTDDFFKDCQTVIQAILLSKGEALSCPAGQAFLAAVARCPSDDTTRLVLADWLEEHDDPARAELIRLQVARAQRTPLFDDPRKESERERTLLRRHGQRWQAPIPAGYRVTFRGGFATAVQISWGSIDWEALAACPTLCELECWLSGSHEKELAELLSCSFLPRLRSLGLIGRVSWNGGGAQGRLDTTGLRLLANDCRFANLASLDLANHPRITSGAGAVLAASPYLRQLMRLNLAGSTLGVDGLRVILRAIPHLRWLDLQGDDLTSRPPGFHQPATFIFRPTVGNEGLLWLAGSPDASKLRWLNISDNHVLPQTAEALARSPYLRGLIRLHACEIEADGRPRNDIRQILEAGFGARLSWDCDTC